MRRRRLQTNRGVCLLVVFCAQHAVSSDGPILPSTECKVAGHYFDVTDLRCVSCSSIDPRALPAEASSGNGLPCVCAAGLVQCASGQRCLAKGESSTEEEAFVARGALECRDCPVKAGKPMAPTLDRTRCLPCGSTTMGYSEEKADCLCPAGQALMERDESGDYLTAKRCVLCADGFFPGPTGTPSNVYGCGPCQDPDRMSRNPQTGVCECEGTQMQGGLCVDVEEFNDVTARFPLASAVQLQFRDIIDGREDYWLYGPFSQSLGIEMTGGGAIDVLVLAEAEKQAVMVSSATVKWLYVRCAVGCVRGNSTACQCISNLCVLALYDEDATVCRLLRNKLYEGLPAASSGITAHVDSMPWLFYSALSSPILTDASLTWKFSLGGADALEEGSTNALPLWLAQYTLEGNWLGWVNVDSQLELCTELGGVSSTPKSSTTSWRRFGSSLIIDCRLPLASLLKCGSDPIFYELFIENVGRELLPVPVRILNMVKDSKRPNINVALDEVDDDVLVRRFTLCDAVSGKEGEGAYLTTSAVPKVFRWAAHMVMEVHSNPEAEAQIYVPVLSIAYADKTTASLTPNELVYVSFAAEYSMSTGTYWIVVLVLFILTMLFACCLACFRMFVVGRRCPDVPVAPIGAAASIFPHKVLLQTLAFVSTMYSTLFWFHFSMGMYWLTFFKLQDTPHLLLPSGLNGGQYISHDLMMVIIFSLGFFVVSIGLYKQFKAFIFLVDWEQAREGDRPRTALNSVAQQLSQPYGGGVSPYGSGGQQYNHGQQPHVSGSQAYGESHHQYTSGAQSYYGGQQYYSGAAQTIGADSRLQGDVAGARHSLLGGLDDNSADAGVSAWRSIFVCNELNERLTATRTRPHVTWLAMAFLLEGLTWKNVARWHPAVSGDEGSLSAQFNPFLQFALGALLCISIISAQILVRRIASIRIGHDLKDFVDVCSVANVSVFFMDEPFHGFYIHGKAPSSRGDWCHTDLLRVLHLEEKGVGFHRGLVEGSVQTYEFFLPQDYEVPLPGGSSVNFLQALHRTFTQVRDLSLTIRSRVPPKPIDADVAEQSRIRCSVQVLIDAMVHSVMRSTREIIFERSASAQFLSLPPEGGIAALRQQPVFYEDKDELAWSSCLAYGSGIRPFGFEIPTGFEWHLILLELLLFSVVWRFADSVYLGVAMAFLLNRGVLYLYSSLGRSMLAHTAIVDSRFLI